MLRFLAVLLAVLSIASGSDLFNRRNLDGWETVGDGVWTVTREGVLIGQRDKTKPHVKTDPDQSWLYTKKEFSNFDLHLEWWTRLGGNSGVSIRDTSRARYSFGPEADRKRTPSHIGYEIQISNGHKDQYPSGSVYLFKKALSGPQVPNDWNAFDIEVRENLIRVRLNGKVVAEHPGDPARSKKGPIGLQLHDLESIVMFRNIRLAER